MKSERKREKEKRKKKNGNVYGSAMLKGGIFVTNSRFSLKRSLAWLLALSLLLLSACQKAPSSGGSSSLGEESGNSASGQQGNASWAYASLFYQNRHYKTNWMTFTEKDNAKRKAVLGDFLGEGKPLYDGAENGSSYPDLTFNVGLDGDVYTVKGYDPKFLLCRFTEASSEDPGGVMFHCCLEGFSFSTGKDLFGDLLHLKEKSSLLGKAFLNPEYSDHSLPENWDAFLEELYAAPAATPQENEIQEGVLLRIVASDGIRADVALYESGWAEFSDVYFRLEGQEYQKVYEYAKEVYGDEAMP